jgi:hypothetical protein
VDVWCIITRLRLVIICGVVHACGNIVTHVPDQISPRVSCVPGAAGKVNNWPPAQNVSEATDYFAVGIVRARAVQCLTEPSCSQCGPPLPWCSGAAPPSGCRHRLVDRLLP